jgi:protease I
MPSKQILILVDDQVDDRPLTELFQAIQSAGHVVHIASPEKKAGHSIQTTSGDLALTANFDSLKSDDYHALVLSGSRSPDYLGVKPSALQLVRFFFESTFRSSGQPPEYGRPNSRVLELIRQFITTNKPIAALGQSVRILNAAQDQTETTPTSNIITAPAGAPTADWMDKFLKLLDASR